MSAIAQPRSGNRAERQLERIKEKIDLNKEQTEKIKTILEKAQEEMRAMFEKSDGDRSSMREAATKRTEQTDAEIEKVLTKKQKEKYQEYKKERQKEMQERRRDRQ